MRGNLRHPDIKNSRINSEPVIRGSFTIHYSFTFSILFLHSTSFVPVIYNSRHSDVLLWWRKTIAQEMLEYFQVKGWREKNGKVIKVSKEEGVGVEVKEVLGGNKNCHFSGSSLEYRGKSGNWILSWALTLFINWRKMHKSHIFHNVFFQFVGKYSGNSNFQLNNFFHLYHFCRWREIPKITSLR